MVPVPVKQNYADLMPILILLLTGVLGYFVWRHCTSSLTRNCRWRQERGAALWRCAFCGAKQPGQEAPRRCLRLPPKS